MTLKEEYIRDVLRNLHRDGNGKIHLYDYAMDEIKNALHKQIPKKLVDYKNISNELIGYSCPRCNAFYSLYGQFIDSNYCPNCGQRVCVEDEE